ncbi:MAG: aminopeptidase P family N-terminal domain-containing protein, partial [Trichococcus flocculiformis]
MSRVSKLQDAIKAKKMDAMLVTSQYNLRYVSNFTGTTGLAVITQEEAFFVTDFRY